MVGTDAELNFYVATYYYNRYLVDLAICSYVGENIRYCFLFRLNLLFTSVRLVRAGAILSFRPASHLFCIQNCRGLQI